jgi:homopolymeric O-antigen transport system permease protein
VYSILRLDAIRQHRELIWEMALRDLKGLNKGAVLGYLWVFILPLVQVITYVLVGFLIMRGRTGTADPLVYTAYVLAGMVPWQMLTRALSDGPSLVRDKMELLKQVIYPIETLPVTKLVVTAIGPGIMLAAYLVLAAALGLWQWTLVLLPVPIAMLVLLCVGLSWLFSILGVLIKDLPQIIAVVLGFLVYLSPVVITPDAVPPWLWRFILLNPLAHVVICFRDVFDGTFHPVSWAVFAAFTGLSFLSGAWVIHRMKLRINEYI